MAKSISISSGSVLIGNPIVVKVVPDSLSVAPVFHRVKLIVSASLDTVGSVETFELSAPVDEGGDGQVFDVSDALRTVARGFIHSFVTSDTTYPYIAFTLSAYDEYMVNGILQDKVNEVNYGGTLYALMGAFSGLDRYTSGETKSLDRFTRKPANGEICSVGDLYVYPSLQSYNIVLGGNVPNPSVSTKTLDKTETLNNVKVYVDENSKNRIQFQFVNSFGVVETASAECLERGLSEGSLELNAVTGVPSFGNPVRLAGTRTERDNILKCSSGFVNMEWAQWWHDEFLGSDDFRRGLAQSHWIYLDEVWQPCICSLDDETTIYDRTKKNMLHIDFTVHLCI